MFNHHISTAKRDRLNEKFMSASDFGMFFNILRACGRDIDAINCPDFD